MVQRPTIRREQAVFKPSLGRQPFGAAAGGAAALQKSQTPSERNDTLRMTSACRGKKSGCVLPRVPMRPDKSGNLEIFFVTNPARQILKKPFFFHRIPKTSGTSLRFATRGWLWRQECGELIAPGFRQEGLDRDRWRRSVADFYRAVASVARVEAVMGHDTAMLAAVVSDPIVAIVREPGAQLASSLAFRPKRLDTTWGCSPRRLGYQQRANTVS